MWKVKSWRSQKENAVQSVSKKVSMWQYLCLAVLGLLKLYGRVHKIRIRLSQSITSFYLICHLIMSNGNNNNYYASTIVLACFAVCKLRCPPGHRCEVDKETGETFCNPNCELDNGGCSSDQICSLLSVQCVRSPCPPTVQCSGMYINAP